VIGHPIGADILALVGHSPEQRSVANPGDVGPGLQGDDRQVTSEEPRSISAWRQPALPRKVTMSPRSRISIQLRRSAVSVAIDVQADDLGAP
jgi:hypothetical protein